MTKSRMTIYKEILIEQSRDVIDVIMQIGGGIMPKTMLVEISVLPQYKDKKLLSQLKPLIKPQSHVMRDNKTIKEYPPLLTSTRLDNYVIYTISLANARLINPGMSYAEPSLDINALVRRLQLIHHRISFLRSNPDQTFTELSMIDSGFLTKQGIPQYLLDVAERVGDSSDRFLAAEAKNTQNALDRMAGGRKGYLPAKIERDKVFDVLGSPTMLSLYQKGVYLHINDDNSYTVTIYEGRNVRDVKDLLKLVKDSTAYFGTLLPNGYVCKKVVFKTVNKADKNGLLKRVRDKSEDVENIKVVNNVKLFGVASTNIFDVYFGGILL